MDPFTLTEAELITYLTELGVEDAVTMEPNDRMRTMLALMGGDEGMPPAENEGGGAGFSTFPVAAPAELRGAHDDHDAVMTDIPANIHSDQMNEHVESYCSITGSDPDSARHLLEALDWDLDAAVTMHMEQEHGDADSHLAPSSSAPDLMDAMNRTDMFSTPNFMGMPMHPGMMAGMSTDQDNALRMGANMHQHTYFHTGDDDDDDQYGDYDGGAAFRTRGMMQVGGSSWAGNGGRSGKADEYDEEGVRMPDPIRHERMIGGMDDFNPYSRADTADVTWLFPPPRQLSYAGAFQEARIFAREDKKWMLVNIQSHLEFSSQMMNRDTFVDETVISLLRTSFVFWQRGHTSPDAENYMRTHNIQESDLPHIAVIDSRTGAKIVTMKGFISPGDLAMALLEFLDDNDFETNKAPKQRNIDATGDFERQVAIAEGRHNINDDDLAVMDTGKAPGITGKEDHNSQNCATQKSDSGDNKAVQNNDFASSGSMKSVESEDLKSVISPVVLVDYGILPAEPPIGDDPNVVKVSVKSPWGKQVVRRFYKTDLVRNIYSFANSLCLEKAETTGRNFDICTAYPSMSMREHLDMTIFEAGVSGSQVIMRWITE